MNQRLLELEVEAIAYADSKVPANDRYNDIYHSIVRGKFAELIVRECSRHVEDKFDFCGDEIIIAEEILKHFGVEE